MRDGIVYDEVHGTALDLYEPAPGEPRPLVVAIHGGGFRFQDRKDDGVVRICNALAARGIVAASIDHRMLHDEPQPSARFAPLVDALPGVSPAVAPVVISAIEDVLSAIGHLHRNAAEYGIDVGRLGLIGASTGAITAVHVAYAIDDHGFDVPPIRFVGSLWGGVFVQPWTIEPGDAALFAVHGEADEMMPVTMSDELVQRAEIAGVHVEYHRVPGLTHGWPETTVYEERLVELAYANV